MQISNCSYPGCLGLGIWTPTVIVKTSENDRVFQLEFPQFKMCDEHKEILKLNDIVGNKNIRQIRAMFIGKTIYPPDKKDMSLIWDRTFISIIDSKGRPVGKTSLVTFSKVKR